MYIYSRQRTLLGKCNLQTRQSTYQSLIIEAETVSETLGINFLLKRLIPRKCFVVYNRLEIFKPYTVKIFVYVFYTSMIGVYNFS